MKKMFTACLLSVLAFSAFASTEPARRDDRIVVSIPAADLLELKSRMRQWQTMHAGITAAIADGNAHEVSTLVYNSSGSGDVQKNGQPPALKSMPEGMVKLGKMMRESSNRMSDLAKKGASTGELLRAFSDVQSVCAACHHTFRVEQGGAK